MHKSTVNIIGAGLAGCEAAWQAVRAGFRVNLYEMRPEKTSKAHKTNLFAELVCSNSLRGASLTNAVGLLKEELKLVGSLIIQAAENAKVPAGGALAVDRVVFSQYIDDKLRGHPLVTTHIKEVTSMAEVLAMRAAPTDTIVGARFARPGGRADPAPTTESPEFIPTIIATGPLTSDKMAASISEFFGESGLSFFDAISPVIFDESIDKTKLFYQSRYDKGDGDDYLNIPLTQDEYDNFVNLLKNGEKFGGHDEVESDCTANLLPFEGCMPIESMLERGDQTLRFGPLKPVGLTCPQTNDKPYAVVQLRHDDLAKKLWNIVGFQTKLKHCEQIRIFRTLPGLENAEFARLGSVHRNTFINSPKFLNNTNELKNYPGIFFAGQITGVEGYVESTASGLVAGINAVRYLQNKKPISFPPDTAVGALLNYISEPKKYFQPMNVNYGLIPFYSAAALQRDGKRRLGKDERRLKTAENALRELANLLESL